MLNYSPLYLDDKSQAVTKNFTEVALAAAELLLDESLEKYEAIEVEREAHEEVGEALDLIWI